MANEDTKKTDASLEDVAGGATARTPATGGADSDAQDQGPQSPGSGTTIEDLDNTAAGATARTPVAGGPDADAQDQGPQTPGSGATIEDLGNTAAGASTNIDPGAGAPNPPGDPLYDPPPQTPGGGLDLETLDSAAAGAARFSTQTGPGADSQDQTPPQSPGDPNLEQDPGNTAI